MMFEKKLIQAFTWAGVLVFCLLALVGAVKFLEDVEAERNIRAGVITDKEVITTSSFIGNSEMRWVLYIEGEYEHEGKKNVGNTHYTVPEDVYLAYNIGDNFDITNYSTENATATASIASVATNEQVS